MTEERLKEIEERLSDPVEGPSSSDARELVAELRRKNASWVELFNAEEKEREEHQATHLKLDAAEDEIGRLQGAVNAAELRGQETGLALREADVQRLTLEALKSAETLTRCASALKAASDEIERLRAELAPVH